MSAPTIFIGCAGWSLPREYWPSFPEQGTHLQRYTAQFNGVEINSSFYRPHQRQTYARWAESVPDGFRFCVKVPKSISHERRLRDCEQALDAFLEQCAGLGDRLGCLLLQLPPSLAFDETVAEAFFVALRQRYSGAVFLELRHDSWAAAELLLMAYRIAQTVVDPSRISTDAAPRGWPSVRYWRLHGSPRIYYSPYDSAYLERLAGDLREAAVDGVETWCIFDNTASGVAIGNALELRRILAHG
ncbi:DUF72 domain-containing protein [Pseudomonas sp. GM25]|uniref:DUF72 domain-containing protein n=1 Tax=Pseudomonas sp. GM25 TaxID=1144327 RepID=UPI00026FF3FD|nr:DUF72 domain-containing protein [Pseudomonas sp. GM25]EJM27484.1 hypothetical protein PMI24_03106 [Pseudomonas sp. GM25]